MNIFENKAFVFGDPYNLDLKQIYNYFFKQANNIRIKLGEKSYLLDKYLSYLFNGINEVLIFSAGERGFDKACELNNLCTAAVKEELSIDEHPFAEKVVNYAKEHPLPYFEIETKASIIHCALAGDFAEYANKKYAEEINYEIEKALDICDLCDLYNEICDILCNKELMNNLNELLKQRFLMVSSSSAFAQGLTNSLLDCLTERDDQTSKQIFQLILDMEEK